jgi:hypothetical protein
LIPHARWGGGVEVMTIGQVSKATSFVMKYDKVRQNHPFCLKVIPLMYDLEYVVDGVSGNQDSMGVRQG